HKDEEYRHGQHVEPAEAAGDIGQQRGEQLPGQIRLTGGTYDQQQDEEERRYEDRQQNGGVPESFPCRFRHGRPAPCFPVSILWSLVQPRWRSSVSVILIVILIAGLHPHPCGTGAQHAQLLCCGKGYVDDAPADRKSTRLNSSHVKISYAVFCLKKKKYKLLSYKGS